MSEAAIADVYRQLGLDEGTRRKLLDWSSDQSTPGQELEVFEGEDTSTTTFGGDDARLDKNPRRDTDSR